jgi:lipopolysaccharide export system permease protein
MFDRLDDFLEAGAGFVTILAYFAVKLPLIVSQLLPAVFLVALVIQLSLMNRSRELLALTAGGISPVALARLFLILGLLWCLVQIVFSQAIGVRGEQKAGQIWSESVKKKQDNARVLKDVWFKEGLLVIHFDQAWPTGLKGEGLTAYSFDRGRLVLQKIIKAKRFSDDGERWRLEDVTELDPATFATVSSPEATLDIGQRLKNFAVVDPHTDPGSLPLWQLGTLIDLLKASGSNVERLTTIWHMKIAYGFAIPVMSLLALAVLSFNLNIYLSVGVSLAATFFYYALFTFFASAGQRGMISPLLGAWLGNLVFGAATGLRLFAVYAPVAFRRLVAPLLPRPPAAKADGPGTGPDR